MSISVLPGDVFKLVCNFPEVSKPKFLILLKTKPYEFFIINSEINNFIANTPRALFSYLVDSPTTSDSLCECCFCQ